MVDKTLLKYVKDVYILECEKYVLEQQKIGYSNTRRSLLSCVREERVNRNNENVNSNNEYGVYQGSATDAKVCIFFGIWAAIGGIGSGWIAALIVSAILLIYGILRIREENTASETFYMKKQVAREENDTKQAEIKRKNDELLAKIRRENSVIRNYCNGLDLLITETTEHLFEKEKALENMYQYNIIHFQYRNLYSMYKIYHVLDTGICDTLLGVNGAYSQIRINEIVDNQKISIELQRQILNTNKAILAATNRTNELLSQMNQQMYTHNTNTEQILHDIRNNTDMTNFLLESAEHDRKALTESVEYLAYAEKQRRQSEGNF